MKDFKNFYIEQKDKLFSYLMRVTGDYHLSMDIMQESFLRCLEKYRIEAVNNSLLYTIARNVMIDHFRKTKRKKIFLENADECQQNQENIVGIKQEYRSVMTAMNALETDEREILALVLTENLKYREIASIMGINEGNVKVRVHRARMKLLKIIQTGETA